MTEVKLCECGCGRPAPIADRTWKKWGWVRNQPKRFRRGHRRGVHGYSSSPTYISWEALIQRCTNPNATNYPKYGGANPPVKICPEWMTFEGFVSALGPRPEGTTLGRILDMGDYTKDNCFWMSKAEQGLARSNKWALLKWAAVSA